MALRIVSAFPERADRGMRWSGRSFEDCNRLTAAALTAPRAMQAGKEGADACYGCHGGRSWYRKSYPYPRHPWPTMDKSTTPDWATARPTDSRPEHLIGAP